STLVGAGIYLSSNEDARFYSVTDNHIVTGADTTPVGVFINSVSSEVGECVVSRNQIEHSGSGIGVFLNNPYRCLVSNNIITEGLRGVYLTNVHTGNVIVDNVMALGVFGQDSTGVAL